MANCLAEGSSLKSLWLDGFEKLFLLRNVTDLYMYIYRINRHPQVYILVHSECDIFSIDGGKETPIELALWDHVHNAYPSGLRIVL